MTTYAGGRYSLIREVNSTLSICRDANLDRRVCIHWVAPVSRRKTVRDRLAALQSVRSPHVALIYDIVEHESQVGVVEEELGERIENNKMTRLRRLYELCAGLSALHDNNLGHGALTKDCFRVGPFDCGRLCNLAFDTPESDSHFTDNRPFAALLTALGADDVSDAVFQKMRGRLAATNWPPLRVRTLRDRLAALLLRDKHRALAYWRATSAELGSERRSARFVHPIPGVAVVTLQYDGTRFFLAEVEGEVRINNIPLHQGADLPDSCVIALGDSNRPRSQRYFITFDQSHPEVA